MPSSVPEVRMIGERETAGTDVLVAIGAELLGALVNFISMANVIGPTAVTDPIEVVIRSVLPLNDLTAIGIHLL
jgi:hypothetical protein